MNPQDKINLINQSFEDAKYLKNEYHPIDASIYYFKKIALLLSLLMLYKYVLGIVSFNLKWYESEIIPSIFNLITIALFLLLPAYMYTWVKRGKYTLKEREFLQFINFFILLFCLEYVFPNISYFFNQKYIFDFFLSFRTHYIIHLIVLFVLSKYTNNNSIKKMGCIYFAYVLIVFAFNSYLYVISSSTAFLSFMIKSLSFVESLRVVEILTYIVVSSLLIKQKDYQYEKNNFRFR